ncbi:MAG: SPFH domain-containing protein [Hormoscilla sp.]
MLAGLEFYLYQCFLLLFFAITGTTLKASFAVVKQGDEALVEMLGKYEGKKLEPGLTFLVPYIERVAYKQSLREQILEMPSIECVTADRYDVFTDFVLYWRMIDLERASYKVQNFKQAMLTVLTLQIRTEIAKLVAEDLFTARSKLNELLVGELDIATEPWGIKVTRVELRNFKIGSKVVHEAFTNGHLPKSPKPRDRAAVKSS